MLRQRSAVGGIRSIFQTHALDIVDDRTTIGVIEVGEQTLTATACVVLKDAVIAPRSLLAAGSVVPAARPDADFRPGLYAGSPAKWRRELPECEWWQRTDHITPVLEASGL